MRKEYAHLAVLLVTAIAVRALLFDKVGIWGDFGFYTYDARLILEGQKPFIDFVGRSPLFLYLYAGARSVIGHPVPLLRVFIAVWWILCAIPVYGIAKRVGGHKAGLAAAAVMLLTPFTLVYGYWANTQSIAAFLAISGVYLIVAKDSIHARFSVGVLFGLAFLSRRSVVVVFGAIGLFLLYKGFDSGRMKNAVAECTSASIGFGVALFSGYLLIAGLDVQTTIALFDTHAMGLISSSGRGGFPLIMDNPPEMVDYTTTGSIPIFHDLCQKCGSWTVRTFAKTLLVTVPLIGPLWYYLHDLFGKHYTREQSEYIFAVLGTIGLYAVANAFLAGYHIRAAAVIALGSYPLLAYFGPSIDRDVLYDREMVLCLFISLCLAAGYLYRPRSLHTYYFMDFVPYIAVLSGVLYANLLTGKTFLTDKITVRQALTVILILGIVTSTFGAFPLTNVVTGGNSAGWFTIGNIDDYQQDLNKRTEPGDKILTAHPSYVAGSDARLANDNPRLHYVGVTFRDTGLGAQMYGDLNSGIENGNIKYVISDKMTARVLEWNETTKELVEDNYCRVKDADKLYQRTNTGLYKRIDDIEKCPTDRRFTLNESG